MPLPARISARRYVISFVASLLGAALLGLLPLPVQAAQYWEDTYYKRPWETSSDVCVHGEAEPRTATYRQNNPGQVYRYNNVNVNEYLPGEESRCIFTIERRVSIFWVTVEAGDVLHIRTGLVDYCPRGTLDALTGRCRPKGYGCQTPNGTNPCDGGTGNKYQQETDYESAETGLAFRRHYNSATRDYGPLGAHWRSQFERRVLYSESAARATVFREDGRGFTFVLAGGVWTPDADVRDRLTKLSSGANPAGWRYNLADGSVENYDLVGRLISITDPAGRVTTLAYDGSGRLASITGPFGHQLTLSYDAQNRVATLTDPATRVYSYAYDANNNLTRVTYPDTRARNYVYENASLPNVLTGIIDENSDRFATYGFNSQAAATLSEHAGGAERHTLAYVSPTRTDITDAANNVTSYTFSDQLGVFNLVNRSMAADGKALTQTFNANNNLTCKRDEEGRVTTYAYNSVSQRTSMTEGLSGSCAAPVTTSATRTIGYTYLSSTLDLPTTISTPSVFPGQSKFTTIAYADTRFPTLPTTITQSGFTPSGAAVARTISLAYNASGQVTSINGPRTDVNDITTLSYYTCTTGGACGQLASVTNAAGHVTTYDSYDGNGRLLQTTDPNGLRTNYVYDPRGRVTTMTQTPPVGMGSARTTQYVYHPAGQLTQVTHPDGRTLTYSYNAAHQLTRITDNLGNRIDYGYDPKGNRTTELTYDPNGTLVRTLSTGYDARNFVNQRNHGGSVTQQIADALGNLTRVTDPNQVANGSGISTNNNYDALRRLNQTLDALSGSTTYGYNAHDKLTQVSAPNGATTQYAYDDLGNLLSETSPDRGTTTYSYDAAGNVTSQTDARGIAVGYTYDALNRVTHINYPTDPDISYTYDSGSGCTHGIGRPCQVTDESGTTGYAYDAFGNIATHTKTELGITYTTRYTYDAADRILSLTYPDNRIVNYTRNGIGRITAMQTTVNGVVTPLTTNRTYRADGLLLTQTYGNGLAEVRNYDQRGQLTYQSLGTADTRVHTYDANGNLTRLQTLPADARFNYDPLDHLAGGNDNAANPLSYLYNYVYDKNGNRTGEAYATYQDYLDYGGYTDGLYYNYHTPGNRLSHAGQWSCCQVNYTHDASGNLTQLGTTRLTYGDTGHLRTANSGAIEYARYTYNHQRLRTRRVAGGSTTLYHFDINDRVIAETTPGGTLLRAFLYTDDAPIAQITRTGTESLLYLHPDHLGTPRLATDTTQTVRWRLARTFFGDTADEDPDRNRQLTIVPLRHPGQYYDGITGFVYNHHRWVWGEQDRYLQADRKGVADHVMAWRASGMYGHSPLELNSYAYVYNNPLRWTDPTGESAGVVVIGVVTVCVGGTLYLAYKYLRPLLQQSATDRLDAMNDIAAGVPGAQQRYEQAGARIGGAASAAGGTGALAMPPPGGQRGIGVGAGRAAGKIAGETYIELKERIGECNGQCPTQP